MENQNTASDKKSISQISIYVDAKILSDFPSLKTENTEHTIFVPLHEAQYAVIKNGNRIWVNYPDGSYCDFPYYLKNLEFIIKNFASRSRQSYSAIDNFESFTKTSQNLEKKIFSSVSLSPEKNVKDLWDEIIKKVNRISSESHSLQGLVEKILDIPFLQNFQSSLLILHLKGQTKAEMIGTLWRGEKVQGLVEVKDFNHFFNAVKKSKIKSFSSELFGKIDIPFNGSFLAKECVSKKFSLIAIVSRHDFLSCQKEEIELFETCIDLLQPHFERLIDQEFSDKRISELRVCLKEFPLPLRITDMSSGASFLNDLFETELQEKDIFFNKKVGAHYTLDLFDSDELRHYAFDLFHFQRISLLGELLNTLRHELSNPLFGLKLSSQIFSTLEVSASDKEFMREIEKNVNRCQIIIENFSNLYQIQTESRPVSVKKMIDESVVLSKSESREVKKIIRYSPETEELELVVPLIFVVQILFNLIVNTAQALKQNTDSPELNISVTKDHNFVFIDVKDNGPGIPQDKLPDLFKPFFTTKSQGTGLGLVLSRNLARKMGGNLEYLVNNNERGAHFRLSLPLI